MNRLSALAHRDHPIASPLADESVRRLLDRALRRGDERLLDLGCAEGEWLGRAVDGRPGVRAVGIDLDAERIAGGRERFGERFGERIELHVGDANGFSSPQPFDLVLCAGSTHAFGGLLPTLEAAARHLAPGGTVLVGEGFWEREPDPATVEIFCGDGGYPYADLATTLDSAVAQGWTPVYGHVSTPHELDDYEWSWTGSLSRWALDHPEDPDSAEALAVAAQHRDEWLKSYRGTFGFVTVLLRRTTEAEG
ncbi:class I SAM-dependent methyltransferase [Streptacidiphilus sp. PAMC 29251]